MAESVRIQKVARLLQKALGGIFLQENVTLFNNMFITVTEVSVSPDLGLAKVYLSFLRHEEQATGLDKVEAKKGAIRRLLGNQVGSKLRKVPELRFYNDDSGAHAAKMHRLFEELN